MSRIVPPYPVATGLLKGKTVVVTAAAGTGIGFSVAKRAAEEGATLLISDFHERRLGEAADAIHAATGHRPLTTVCDVTVEEQVQGLRDAALVGLGHVDVLINNAGLGGEVNVVDMTDAQWARVLDVTLTSVMRMTRAFLPAMQARGSGCNRQQRFGARLAGAKGPGALRRRQGRGHGLHPLQRHRGRRISACASTPSPPASPCTPFSPR